MSDTMSAPFPHPEWVKPGAGGFTTDLPLRDEIAFQKWVVDNKVPFDSRSTQPSDYDMRGFYKALMAGDPMAQSAVNQNDKELHYPDYWKTPYHESFSRQSQWALPDAPDWNDEDQLVLPDGSVVFDERALAAQRAQGAQQ